MADVGIGVDLFEYDDNGEPSLLWWSLNALAEPERDAAVNPPVTAKEREEIGLIFLAEKNR